MFNIFKSKKKSNTLPSLSDIDGNELNEGDEVEALRYDLGKCKVILIDKSYYYESLDSGKQVLWLKMIDASTERQKVKKIQS